MSRWLPLWILALAACGGDQPFQPNQADASVNPGPTDGGHPDVQLPSYDGAWGGSGKVRIMSANTTSGNFQSYDPGEGIRLFQGLHPDIAMIQEFNYGTNSDADVRHFVDTAFGTDYGYYREPAGLQIPNGIVSRFPILASGRWVDPKVSNRGFAWAKIDVPGPHDLWVVSVHLLTSNASDRQAEATSLVGQLQANVAAGDYIVIGGDFNTGARTEACVTELATVVSNAAPYPVDNAGNQNTNSSRSKPYDWVMPSANLRALETPVVIGAQSFTDGLVVDSRVFTPLADITPVMSGDSSATNMQHMAVVADFNL